MSMWKVPTRVVERIRIAEGRRILMSKVCHHFDVPPRGVVFVLEKEDCRCYHNSTWRSKGIHLSIKDAPLEERSPDHLLRLMKSRKYSNLIWLSRQACEGQDVEFAWTLSHELRHLEQDLSSHHALSRVGYFLSCAIGEIDIEEPKVENTIPTELDANLRALTVTQTVLGTKEVNSYIQHESSASEEQKQHFDILKSHDCGEEYDVFGCTVNLLRKYEPQLEEFQKGYVDVSLATFDIERVCAELSGGPNSIQQNLASRSPNPE